MVMVTMIILRNIVHISLDTTQLFFSRTGFLHRFEFFLIRHL